MISPAQLETRLRELIRQALTDLQLSPDPSARLELPLEPPRNRAHGDLATSVAMQMAALHKRPPMELAQKLSDRLNQLLRESDAASAVERVEPKPPGFVNFFLSRPFFYSVLQEVLRAGKEYGRSQMGRGKRVMVEFVSANPTGPLSVAHGRQAAVGDALANLLDAAGYRVHREYYLNDEGTQIDLLGKSVLARAKEAAGFPAEFPENGYKGGYVRDIGARFLEQKGKEFLGRPEAEAAARKFGAGELTQVIRGELDAFGVKFDEWHPQSSLEEKAFLQETLDLLKKSGHLYESEGAWWLKSTAFGDDKDRVVIRSDGRLTYIAADIAYHRRKLLRGFELLVNLWGPDHHGYIPRLTAAVQALGYPKEALQVRIVQLCTLKRGTETIPMSTREGQFITLTQVMEEVGKDAARFFFLLRKMDAHLEFDLELAKKHSLENPVYYIQYAHARISNILEKAKTQEAPSEASWSAPTAGIGHSRTQKEGAIGAAKPDLALLTAPEELALLGSLREFPSSVEASARSLEPFGLTNTLQRLAEQFHRFYDVHRVVGVEPALSAARLELIRAVQVALANGLRLLGVTAPEKM
ncbi:MAG: arginine--tRNA ligase [Candidatus Omnitrophica bacterium]|nr:arginine--tRNA ligase [Candidatus Omnitrophota bacterium]